MKTINSENQTKMNKNGRAGKGHLFSFIFNIVSQAYISIQQENVFSH